MNTRSGRAAMLAVPLLMILLAGCAESPVHTRELDTRFGDAVRQARARQTLNPEASRNTDPVSGIDGVAAQHAIEEYQKSFREPPPSFNVLGIGGATASP